MVHDYQSDPNPSTTHVQTGAQSRGDDREVAVNRVFAPLPAYVQRQLPHQDEEVVWVRGPWLGNPRWERWMTSPFLFLVGLGLAALCILIGYPSNGDSRYFPPGWGLAAVLCIFLPIALLAFFNGYFTRLVVSNHGVYIIQGATICRQWGLDFLPRSLVRFERDPEDDTVSKTVDLEAMTQMLNSSEGHFTDAKSIKDLGKNIERLRKRENERS